MSEMRQWTIGSSVSCELFVDAPTVSSIHCRLSRTKSGLQIEDLGSTNGTLVEGSKIQKPTTIRPSSRVTLGTNLQLPWPDADTATRIITIGRSDENNCQIDAQNISTFHARLIVGPLGTLVLEDLGSTNGTWITKSATNGSSMPGNDPPIRITKLAMVYPDQTILLGSKPILVSELLEFKPKPKAVGRAMIPDRVPHPIPVIPDERPHSDVNTATTIPYRGAFLALAGLAAVAVLLLAFSFLVRMILPGEVASGDTKVAGLSNTNATSPSNSELTPAPVQVNEPEQLSSSATNQSVDTFDALHWVLIRSGTPELSFRVGTAWSPNGKILLTSAGVIEAMKQLLNQNQQGGVAMVVHGASGNVARVVASGTHREFPKRLLELEETSRTLAAKMEQLRAPADAPSGQDEVITDAPEAAANAMKKSILELNKKMFDQTQAVVCYDVGWLRVEPPISAPVLKLATMPQPRPKQKLRIAAGAFDIEDPYFDDSTLFEPSWTECRVKALLQPPGVSQRRLLANGNLSVTDVNLFGAPMMNEKNEVVGMFAGARNEPTSQPEKSKQLTPTVAEIDGVLSASMIEMIEELERR